VEKHYSKTKTMWGNIVAIHSVFFLNTKQNSQPAQYEKNKIDKDHFRKKKFIKRKKENHAWYLVIIYNVLKKKNYITKLLTSSILKKNQQK